ncbi:MAG: hypothetical protein JST92_10270 [Deltaproteobacteria bacterium]|nr:hypothetical protein [Deltaproteobacteria bacterium]
MAQYLVYALSLVKVQRHRMAPENASQFNLARKQDEVTLDCMALTFIVDARARADNEARAGWCVKVNANQLLVVGRHSASIP